MTLSRMGHALSIAECSAQSDRSDERAEELVLAETTEASCVLDEEAWDDAVDQSGVDCRMLCYSQWRSSMPSSVD